MPDYWMKLYVEILDDPKMATLPDRLWRRVVELFLVAKRVNKDGHLPDTRQIAWMLRVNPDELDMDMAQIVTTGIVEREVNGWFIPKFSARQSAVSDLERKQQERRRKQSHEYYGPVTDLSRNVTQSREQKTETEAEAEAESASPVFDLILETLRRNGLNPATQADVDAIQEIEKMGATIEDLKNGLDWKAGNNGGKPVRYVSALIGPTRTAMQKRLQNGNGHTGDYYRNIATGQMVKL